MKRRRFPADKFCCSCGCACCCEVDSADGIVCDCNDDGANTGVGCTDVDCVDVDCAEDGSEEEKDKDKEKEKEKEEKEEEEEVGFSITTWF